MINYFALDGKFEYVNNLAKRSHHTDLTDKWHQVVRNALGIFPDLAALVGANRIEVSQQDTSKFFVRES